MITLLVEENNPLTPNFYNDLISNLQFHQLTCPCGHSACLSVHGYYNRFIKLPLGKISFRICRVICDVCEHTHSILLSSMVPYSQISLKNHVSILINYENYLSQETIMDENPSIDESNYRYIIRCYKNHWQEKLRAERIYLSDTVDLIKSCFSLFSRQFMQIRRAPNILFTLTT